MKLGIAICVALFTLGSLLSYGNSLDKFDNITTVENLDEAIKRQQQDPNSQGDEPRRSSAPTIENQTRPRSIGPGIKSIGIGPDKLCREFPDWKGCRKWCRKYPKDPACRDKSIKK